MATAVRVRPPDGADRGRRQPMSDDAELTSHVAGVESVMVESGERIVVGCGMSSTRHTPRAHEITTPQATTTTTTTGNKATSPTTRVTVGAVPHQYHVF